MFQRVAKWGVGVLCLCRVVVSADSQPDDLEVHELFESKVRPLLVNQCFGCHSGEAEQLKGGLRLDSREALLLGGDSGPAIVPGDPNVSRLIQNVRGDGILMPPEGKGHLSENQIAALAQWIALGAPWPTSGSVVQGDAYDWEAFEQHWAWRPLEVVDPPDVPPGYRIQNPIDRFVVSGLHQKHLPQAQVAPIPILVRRMFLDLVGLPPEPEELELWCERLGGSKALAPRPEGVSQLIDELLNRPQYGERWARHWLDVARYSDTGGWTQDNRQMPNAWEYRDWVVRAFNEDLPYRDFVRHQIAGDAISADAAVGTGFFALGPRYSSDGGDPESIAQAKGETLDDRVDTFSRAFLGLTVSCARCHDHKFDPIPTEDYYSLAGVFNNSREGETPLVGRDVVERYQSEQSAIRKLSDRIKTAREEAKKSKQEVTGEAQTRVDSWQVELDSLKAKASPKYAFAHTIHDAGSEDMKVALRGNLLKPGPVAPRRFLRIVSGAKREAFQSGSGRVELAAAVVGENNALTPRVIVNRVWLHHFGRALVRTPSNFGVLGEKPTHPDLLNWLADSFVRSGWSFKALHRLIMSSATYQSSSQFIAKAFEQDGDNRSLWRMNPRRMDVETWRDALLSVTGELDGRLGGPAVPDIVSSPRRTLYAKVSRNDPSASDQFLRLFDFPIPRASSAKRTANVVPQQFLFMLNSPFMLERAEALANRLQRQGHDVEERVRRAYSLLFGRLPEAEEYQAAYDFVHQDAKDAKAWRQYLQVLLSANEFMYIR